MTSKVGLIGLGVMGSNLSLNILDKGFALSVFNRVDVGEENMVQDFLKTHKNYPHLKGFTSFKEFVVSLEKPRQIVLMIKAGEAVDMVIDQLIPYLEEGDIIIDGGNSHFKDTARRVSFLEDHKNLHFIGCGISGGAKGARFGPSMMPGGDKSAYEKIAPILNKISAKDKNGLPCRAYIGKNGAGHFVKMIHNGIEYAEMQLLAEVYALLSIHNTKQEIINILSDWNKSELSSYLLDITIKILSTKEGDEYLLDKILDEAANKGTGFWSVQSAMELGETSSMMASALFARFISSKRELRNNLGNKINQKDSDGSLQLDSLKQAYQFARIINHHQGFEVLKQADREYGFDLNLSEIARIWTNGCIIRSSLMEDLTKSFKTGDSILENSIYFNFLKQNEEHTSNSIKSAIDHRTSFDCFYSAYNYWIAMTTKRLPANLIQAQRDFFGGHTFKRTDRPYGDDFNFNWED